MSLDALIQKSLAGFVDEVFAKRWIGEEREMVSFYTLGFLANECRPGEAIESPAQIGIEVRVPQLSEETLKAVGLFRTKAKQRVCKDIVIWPEQGMTCWNEDGETVRTPMAIMEWKGNRATVSLENVNWLKAYSELVPGFVGYAVSVDLRNRAFKLLCQRIEDGDAVEWLRL